MKQQPVIGGITVIGTALSILLIMVVMMAYELQIMPLSPENCRDRLLIGRAVCVQSDDGQSASPMSVSYAHTLYDSLPHVEAVSYVEQYQSNVEVSKLDDFPIDAYKRGVDDVFWRIFDFTFLYGRPFNEAEVASELNVAIITEKIAREVFGTADAVGKEVIINAVPHNVVGVVKDVSTLANNSYAQVFLPSVPPISWGGMGDFFGTCEALLLVDDMDNVDEIRAAVKNRIDAINSGLKQENKEISYFGSPFTQAESLTVGSDNAPDHSGAKKRMYIYTILLLIPAINLSSMTHSRLRRRMSEIGVRRAFGCTRIKILGDIIAENFIISVLGGVIGLLLSIAFAFLFTDLFLQGAGTSYWGVFEPGGQRLTLSMFFRWNVFGWTLLFCFILNLLSSGVPAYRASRMNPAVAIGGINK